MRSPAEVIEGLAETVDLLRAGIAQTTADLEAQGIDPLRAVDHNGRPILLDAIAAQGQVEAAFVQLLAARMPRRAR